MNDHIRQTKDAIQAVFAQYGVSKSLKVVDINGIDFVAFYALHRGEYVIHWARIGYPVLRGGSGRLDGTFDDALLGVAREEDLDFRRLRPSDRKE